ncbi:MAG TPA: glycosyltransferase family 2 protein [Thermoanaerobaculia bacterium]|nr:glycosyltransferase family 2 protein [Thermoanaerobaculia bacterium]
MPPKVSVLVPVHRGADALATSLRTILGQTFPDFEVIVAGDGADTEVERAALAPGDPRVRFVAFAKAPGYGYSNRRRAVGMASGSSIAYLAPDDLWAPDHLERLVDRAGKDRADLVFSRPVLVWSRGVLRPHYLPFDAFRAGTPPRILLACLSPSHVLHGREIHDRAGGWTDDVRRHGDVHLWLRMRSAGARIVYLREATAVRFPSYAFAGREGARRALQDAIAERLLSGALSLPDLRWPMPRRIAGWIEDVAVAGVSRGPRWAEALLRRLARSRVLS